MKLVPKPGEPWRCWHIRATPYKRHPLTMKYPGIMVHICKNCLALIIRQIVPVQTPQGVKVEQRYCVKHLNLRDSRYTPVSDMILYEEKGEVGKPEPSTNGHKKDNASK